MERKITLIIFVVASILSIGGIQQADAILYASEKDGDTFIVNVGAGTFTPNGNFGASVLGTTEIECLPSSTGITCYSQLSDGAFSNEPFDITIPTVTGAAVPNGASFTGLEYVGTTLYGTHISGGGGATPSTLSTLDPTTGISVPIGLTGVGAISGLAYDIGAGIMYGIAGGPGPASLYTIDLTLGTATLVGVVGATGIQAGSLQFGPDGLLYAGGTGGSDGDLFEISPADGSSTFFGTMGSEPITGLTLIDDIDSFGDFTCWISVDPGEQISSSHVIEDQFGTWTQQEWEQSEYCAATTKFISNQPAGESPFEPDLNQHYQAWFYEDPVATSPGTGQLVNLFVPQFDYGFDTTIGELDQIMVPATKVTNGQGDVYSVDEQQHWNCYNIFGPPPPVPPGAVDLETQHGFIDDVTLGDAFLLCAPMIKDGSFGQLLDEHMVCYDIIQSLDQSVDLPIQMADQLTNYNLIPFVIDFASPFFDQGLEKLCVPAFKSFPTVGGSDVSINTSALLLAGVSSVSMWMIPVVISGVGIGVFVIKRRN